jgi:hypothetical protein
MIWRDWDEWDGGDEKFTAEGNGIGSQTLHRRHRTRRHSVVDADQILQAHNGRTTLLLPLLALLVLSLLSSHVPRPVAR